MKDLQVKWNILNIDPRDQQSEHDVLKDELIYGIAWTDNNYSSITKEYGEINVFLHNTDYTQDNKQMQSRELEIEVWDYSKHQRVGIELMHNIYIWWIKDTNDVSLRNSNKIILNSEIAIRFSKWTGHDYWKSESEINERISNSFMGVVIDNPYYDQYDINQPMKKSLTTQTLTTPVHGITKEVTLSVMQNSYAIYSSIFNTDYSQTGHFYSIDEQRQDFEHFKNNNYAEINLRMSTKHAFYETNICTIFDFIGQLGGMFEIFEVLGKLIIGYYTNKMFYHYAINWLHKQDDFDVKANQKLKHQGSKRVVPNIKTGRIDKNSKSAYTKANSHKNMLTKKNEREEDKENVYVSDPSQVNISFEHQNLPKLSYFSTSRNNTMIYDKLDLCYNLFCCVKFKCGRKFRSK